MSANLNSPSTTSPNRFLSIKKASRQITSKRLLFSSSFLWFEVFLDDVLGLRLFAVVLHKKMKTRQRFLTQKQKTIESILVAIPPESPRNQSIKHSGLSINSHRTPWPLMLLNHSSILLPFWGPLDHVSILRLVIQALSLLPVRTHKQPHGTESQCLDSIWLKHTSSYLISGWNH